MPGSMAVAAPGDGPVHRPSGPSRGPSMEGPAAAGAAGGGAAAIRGASVRPLLQAASPRTRARAGRTVARMNFNPPKFFWSCLRFSGISPFAEKVLVGGPRLQRLLEEPPRIVPEGLPRTLAGIEHVAALVNLESNPALRAEARHLVQEKLGGEIG